MMNIRWQYIVIVFLAGWLAACSTTARLTAPSANRSQDIVGSRHLMRDELRKRTSPEVRTTYPVEVSRYRRGWFARETTLFSGATSMGARPDREGFSNAVLYKADPVETSADMREMSNSGTNAEPLQSKPLQTQVDPDAKGQNCIYVGMPQDFAPPDARHSGVQSHVAIFVSPCLAQEQRLHLEDLSRQRLATTTDASGDWIHDRLYPQQPLNHLPKSRQIHEPWVEKLQQYLYRIRMESGG